MKKNLFFVLMLTFSFFAFCEVQSLSNNAAFSSDAILSFADYLYEQNFFSEAASEYERFLFIKNFQIIPEKSEEEKIIFKLADIYNKENSFEKIISLEKKYSLLSSTALVSHLTALQAKYYFFYPLLDFDYAAFVEEKKNNHSMSKNLSELLELSSFIYFKDFIKAKDFSKTLSADTDFFNPVTALLEKYKIKKPALAGFFSVLCPGSGKIYNGAYAQGFSAFVSIASLASACAYFACNNGVKDWRTWTFGAMGVSLWVVDVYGACSGAKRVNQANYRHLKESVKGLFDEI